MSSDKGEAPAVGAFVKVTVPPFDARGVGKLSRLHGRQAIVTYFDVPDELDPPQVTVPLDAVRIVDLLEQSRVFQFDEAAGRWQVGRVLDGVGPRVLVQFPNNQIENLPREELQVRWKKPIANPVAFLIRGVVETPRFAHARSNFIRAVTRQRAGCLGMGAVLASCIQLADYQFNVVQRVLQDPMQRYLLADEVGLGKTIEAGILIRQYVLDAANTASVLLIVPPSLVLQWRQELVDRFSLGAWIDDFVYVVASDDLHGVQARIGRVGMLVVDEAHHLARSAGAAESPLYELLRRHAPAVPRLLLLSATPVLSDTAGFLRVLHLLDPVVFPLDDLPGFERRLQARQLVAESVAALVPENALSMEDDLDRLQSAFGDDAAITSLIAALRPIVQSLPAEDDEAFVRALSELRSHLTETYKLHRRILRNRRKSFPWATPRRNGLEVATYACPTTAERNRALEELRVHLINLDSIAPMQAELFAAAVHPCAAASLGKVLGAHGIADVDALTLAHRVDTLSAEIRRQSPRTTALVQVVRRLLQKEGLQVVVFCSRPADADQVGEALVAALPGTVERHRSGSAVEDLDEVDEPWRIFLTNPSRCRVLVCDASAEEGLNLHGGHKVALHYDLPAAPNRIEQRLGRLDRFGSGDPIKSIALVCSTDPDESAWVDCLNEGLQVFGNSIASLQYLVEELMRSLAGEWAHEGAEATRKRQIALSGPTGWVARERRRIDQQDALDALGEPQLESFENLEAVDEDWIAWREAFDGFAVEALQFIKRPESWSGALPPGEQVFRLNYVRETGRQTLLSLHAFVSEFLGTIDTEARHSTSRSPLTFPYAFRRNTALSKQGRKLGVRPLRYGDALVEALQAFCEADDRGRVFAMWRHLPGYQPHDASGTDLYFRFDFLVEADVVREGNGPEDADEARALGRRADGHFPPHFYTVWVGADGVCSIDPPAQVVEPYRPHEQQLEAGRDYNLNPRRWKQLEMQNHVPWLIDWSRHCRDAEAAACAYLVGLNDVQASIRQAVGGLRDRHYARSAQIASRISKLHGAARAAEMADLDAEESSHKRLVSSMQSPAIRLDVAGAVFVSATTPFAR